MLIYAPRGLFDFIVQSFEKTGISKIFSKNRG
jgi:hypothetical protein